MFCKKCGAEIKEGAQFCPKCGAKANERRSSSSAPQEKEKVKVPGKQPIYIVAGVFALVLIISIGFFVIRKGEAEPEAEAEPELVLQELTLDEQLSLLGEYMDTNRPAETKELMSVMLEAHYDEPELYLGMAEIMEERDQMEAAFEILLDGYKTTKDGQIKSEVLEMQARLQLGDEATALLTEALGFVEDFAGVAGLDGNVESAKSLLNRLYGYYLDSK